MASNNGAAVKAIGSSAPTSYKIPLSIFPVAAARTKPSAMPLRSMIAAFPHDQSQDRGRPRAKRHANPDLACASRHRIRFDSVETNDGQTKRKSPKDGEQRRAGANKPKVQVRIKILGKCLQRNDRD